jgi:hypothetical protein
LKARLLLALERPLELVQAEHAEAAHPFGLFDRAPKIGDHRPAWASSPRF